MSWIPKELENLRLHETEQNGNCFFSSVQIILKSVGVETTVSYLRHVVAEPVLKNIDDPMIAETIKSWAEIYMSAIKENNLLLINEYKHMRDVIKRKNNNIQEGLYVSQHQLYKNMLSSEYWGEQHACRIIEEQTQMGFLVFNGDIQGPQITWHHSSNFHPTHYCMLYLAGQHYMPVSWNNKFIFKWNELTLAIQTFFKQQFKNKTK